MFVLHHSVINSKLHMFGFFILSSSIFRFLLIRIFSYLSFNMHITSIRGFQIITLQSFLKKRAGLAKFSAYTGLMQLLIMKIIHIYIFIYLFTVNHL